MPPSGGDLSVVRTAAADAENGRHGSLRSHAHDQARLAAHARARRAFAGCDAGTKPETKIEIVTPVIHLSKPDIIRRGVELGAPLDLTWSCYTSEDLACGRCDSCALRLRAFQQAGMSDPIAYA